MATANMHKNLVIFFHCVVFELCKTKDRQTNILIAIHRRTKLIKLGGIFILKCPPRWIFTGKIVSPGTHGLCSVRLERFTAKWRHTCCEFVCTFIASSAWSFAVSPKQFTTGQSHVHTVSRPTSKWPLAGAARPLARPRRLCQWPIGGQPWLSGGQLIRVAGPD